MRIPEGTRNILIRPREEIHRGRVGVYGRSEFSEIVNGPKKPLRSGFVKGWDNNVDPELPEETEVIFNPVHAAKVKRGGVQYLSVPTEHIFGEINQEAENAHTVSQP